MVRLQKFLADAGVASRRASEDIIEAGRVQVNGEVVKLLGSKVDPAKDRVMLDGREVQPLVKRYLLLNKPRRYLCSRSADKTRPSVMELIPRNWSHLYSVGRLDFESEGLLLLTNDGDFSLKMTHPRFGIIKKYMVKIRGAFDPAHCEDLLKGVFSEGEKLKAEKVILITSNPRTSVMEIELQEGKNREIRRMLKVLGYQVERLIRTQIGKVQLGDLQKGKWRVLRDAEVRSLMKLADVSLSSADG